jgi:uncharacterized membrane protein
MPNWGWVLLVLLATALGVASLRYALPTVPFPTRLPNFRLRHPWLVAHAIFAATALLAGPWQFLPGLRSRWLPAHRWIGRVYCGAVAAGWLTSLPIAFHANTGAIASAGFVALGAFWIVTTLSGYLAIRHGRVQTHRRWMMRSYALTAAAITFRLYLPVLSWMGIHIPVNYMIVTWAGWIPNLLFAEWLIWRTGGRMISSAVRPHAAALTAG